MRKSLELTVARYRLPLDIHSAVDQYRALALAIEAAVAMDRWDEVEAMIGERDIILDRFNVEKATLSPLAQSRLQGCDQHLIEFLMGTKGALAAQIKDVAESAQMRKAYRTQPQAASLDQPG